MDGKLIKELGLPPDVLRANKHALDEEFEKHPQHLQAVAFALADAKLDRDEAKQFLTRIEGSVRKEQKDQGSGDKRITDKDVASRIANDPEVRRAEDKLNDAEWRVDSLFGLLNALQAKTSALKHLSELWQTGYYTTSSGRRPRSTVREDR